MRKTIVNPGDRFGMLTIVIELPSKLRTFLCLCDCGMRKAVALRHLVGTPGYSKTLSCGCYNQTKHVTHGKTRSKEWNVWAGMVKRCVNPNAKGYDRYGGRGITVCEQWQDFSNFFTDMGECPVGFSLDRIDNGKGYEPGNCRWATMKEQNRNRRDNVMIEIDGVSKTLAEWAEESPVTCGAIKYRLSQGWEPHDAVFKERYQ